MEKNDFSQYAPFSVNLYICKFILHCKGNEAYCDDKPNAVVSNSLIEGEFKQHIDYVASLKCANGYKVKNGQPLTSTCTYNGAASGIWVPSSTCESMRFTIIFPLED